MPSLLAPFTTPTNLIQATNILLESISSATIASLDARSTNTDAGTAINRIGEVLRETCSEGWVWCMDLDFLLSPNADGEIVLPSNCVRFVQRYLQGTEMMRLVIRGNRLYDTLAHTKKLNHAVLGDLTLILDFEDLPESARWYVVCKACRRFTSGKMASSVVYQFTKADEDAARLRMEQEAAETEPESMNENPHIQRLRLRRQSGLLW